MGRRKLSIEGFSRDLLERVGLFPSQRACARAIGISEGTLSGILADLNGGNGNGTASVPVACRLAVFLGRDPKAEFHLAELPEGLSLGARSEAVADVEQARRPRRAPRRSLVSAVGSDQPRRRAFTAAARWRVFISHKFGNDDAGASVDRAVKGLIRFLREHGFEVLTGRLVRDSVREGVLRAIEECDFFVALITAEPGRNHRAPDSATPVRRAPSWLIEEKAVAIALRKPMVLLVESGVEDFGSLHADHQIIPFNGIEILSAIYDAYEQLLALASGG